MSCVPSIKIADSMHTEVLPSTSRPFSVLHMWVWFKAKLSPDPMKWKGVNVMHTIAAYLFVAPLKHIAVTSLA